MNLLNATPMPAGYTMGMEPSGRESLVVAVKGTFTLPENGGRPRLADEQVPLVEADAYTGEPGLSAPLYESDYARFKPRCDVLLNGSAYAPNGIPAQTVTVALAVGSMQKAFNVVGRRQWDKGVASIAATAPLPFTVMPISYDSAYGGSDHSHADPAKHKAFMPNPIGIGFHSNHEEEALHDKPLPTSEEIGAPVRSPLGNYRPMAFGPVGRGWVPRLKLAGTYDQNWIDNVFPFLPSDFDDGYYQAAPADQQTDYLRGEETVVLSNLTADGQRHFQLPKVQVPVVYFLKKGERKHMEAAADTLVIEPDLGRFTITWRSSLPLKKNMFEVVEVLAGEMPRGWWRARELGKTYYRSLKDLALAKRREAEEAGL